MIYVVHGRLHAFPAVIAGKWLGKPVLVRPGRGGEAHFDLSVVQRKRLLGPFFARSIARNTTAWVANSQEIEADLERWGVAGERVHAIPNGVEIPHDEKQRSRNGVVQFVSMGRLEAEKAVEQTICAFASLPADAPAQLTILGDGLCRPELEALSRRLGQERRIAFTGAVGDVTPYLKEADVYVSTSVSEGMSNALLEAMSSGVMPVVSRVSGADDLVEEGVSGLLFSPGDEMALARRLEKSLAMTAECRRAMGEEARKAVRDRFCIDRVAEHHLSLYRSLIESATMRKSLTQRTLEGAAWIGGASVARLALRVVSVAILARLLTPHDYGVVAGALIAMDFASMIYGMGLAPTLVQRKEVRPDHVATAFFCALLIAFLAAVGMWYAAPLRSRSSCRSRSSRRS